jgi:hypothetical protein
VEKAKTDGVVPAEAVSYPMGVCVLVLVLGITPATVLFHDSGLPAGGVVTEAVGSDVGWLEKEHCWLAVEQLTHTGRCSSHFRCLSLHCLQPFRDLR